MAVGDVHRYGNGTTYVETDHGPNIWWTCDDCGAPAATCLDWCGAVRCSGCWPKFHGLDKIKKSNPDIPVVLPGAGR